VSAPAASRSAIEPAASPVNLARALQALCTAAIVAAAAFTLILLDRSGDIADRIDDVHRLNETVTAIVDASTAASDARTALIRSPDPETEDAFDQAIDQARSALGRLRQSTIAGDPTLARIAEFGDLAESQLAALTATEPTADDAALRQTTQQVVAIARSIEDGQNTEVITAAFSMRQVRRSLLISILGMLIAAIVLGAASAIIERRHAKTIDQARRALVLANADLEARIEERTREVEAANTDLETKNARIEGLLTDMNHRIGNSLQFVSSFLRMQERVSDSEEVKQALSSAGDRIMAIASAQRRLRLIDDHEHCRADTLLTDFPTDLQQVISTEGDIRISVDAKPVTMRGEDAVALCVAVGELITNAAKYAFDGLSHGEISLTVGETEGDGSVVVEVIDDGCGLPLDATPSAGGLGLKVVETMVQSIGATITATNGETGTARPGTRISITVPPPRTCDRPEPA